MHYYLFIFLTVITVLIIGCSAEAAQSNLNQSGAGLSNGEKLKVVATTNIIGNLVSNIGDDKIELTSMLPVGSDPHTFNPSPQDVTKVADAHVVFVNGLHLEEFLDNLIDNAGGSAAIVPLSTNVNTRQFGELDNHGHSDEEGEHHDEDAEEHENEGEHHDEDEDTHDDEHNHQGADPHIWMSPANAMIMVDNIEHALSEFDPDNAETYEANAKDYKAELEELDDWVQAQIESIPADNRKMVTDHDSFGYFADQYGLEIVGAVIPSASTNAEPSAQELAALQEQINKIDVNAVFVGTSANPVLAQRLAEDSGIKLVPLYTGSLGKDGSGAETYIDYIKYNTNAIVEALK